MAYPLSRTWQHAWNQAPGDTASAQVIAQNTLQFLAGLMTGTQALTNAAGGPIGSPTGIWPIVGSSDGTTAALDGTNRMVAGSSSWVYATAGSDHSWLVLGPGPNGGYLNIDYSSASGNYYVNLYQSKSAPTGGSITARPTATDETSVLNLQLNNNTHTGNWSLHGILSTYGDVWMGVNHNTDAYLQSFFTWHYFGSPKGTDTCPWGICGEFSTSTPGEPSSSFFGPSIWRVRPPDNSGAPGFSVSFNVGRIDFAGSFGFYDAAFPTTGDAQDSTIPGWPVPCASYSDSTHSNVTQRGMIVDFKHAGLNGSVNTQNGLVEPISGTPDAVVLGAMWVPCNVSSVTL